MSLPRADLVETVSFSRVINYFLESFSVGRSVDIKAKMRKLKENLGFTRR